MSKKLQGNGLFESSRMMLFEHRDALIARGREPIPATTPSARRVLDDQRREEIAARLGAALSHGAPVRLTLAAEPENVTLEGVLVRYDAAGRRVRMDSGQWIKLDQLVDIDE